jgi:nitroreductase
MSVFEAIYSLRAVRIYQEAPIPQEHVEEILRAATRACSSGNTQPWEFVVVTDKRKKATLKAIMTEAMADADRRRIKPLEELKDSTGRSVTGHAAIENLDRVPVIVLVCWNPDRGIRIVSEYEENPDGTLREVEGSDGMRVASLFPACQNMMLAAQALGVASLFTTFFRRRSREIKELFHIPPRIFLEAAIFLGYSAEKLGRGRRLPLEDVVHVEDWSNPYVAST